MRHPTPAPVILFTKVDTCKHFPAYKRRIPQCSGASGESKRCLLSSQPSSSASHLHWLLRPLQALLRREDSSGSHHCLFTETSSWCNQMSHDLAFMLFFQLCLLIDQDWFGSGCSASPPARPPALPPPPAAPSEDSSGFNFYKKKTHISFPHESLPGAQHWPAPRSSLSSQPTPLVALSNPKKQLLLLLRNPRREDSSG